MKKSTKLSQSPIFEELEPRLLFSADGVEGLVTEAIHEQSIDEPPPVIAEQNTSSTDEPAADTPPQSAQEQNAAEPESSEEQTDTQQQSAASTEQASDTNAISNAEQPVDKQQTEQISFSPDISISESTSEQSTATGGELVFVNDNVHDHEQLVEDIRANNSNDRPIEVVILHSNSDGIIQISETLHHFNELDAIHVISYGGDGRVQLGETWYSNESGENQNSAVAAWGDSMAEDGDILFYGCDIASGDFGKDFIDNLAQRTGADIAASDDLTGTVSGDLELEYQTGSIDTDLIITPSPELEWNGDLDTSTDLVGHWTFDEGSGTTATDSSGSNVSGTLYDGPVYTTGIKGAYGLNFSGDYDRIEIDDTPSLDFGNGDFSVSFWFNSDQTASGQHRLFGDLDGGTAGFIVYNDTGTLMFQVTGNDGTSVTEVSGAFTGQWHHVVGIRSGNTFRLYMNKVENDSSTVAVGNINTGHSLRIGASSSSTNEYDGLMDDVRLYNRALTITDITELFNDAPTLISLSNDTIVENTDTSEGTTIGLLVTTDADTGDTASYSINGGTNADLFAIGGAENNELIITAGNLDYETQSSYNVTVRVTDSGGEILDQNFTINVSDIANTLIVDITTNDNDSGIVSGNTNHTAEWLNANKGADASISLREAIIAANNTSGTDSISFNIAGSGIHTIDVASALPAVTDTIIIDGTTESDFIDSPMIELYGHVRSYNGLLLDTGSDGSTIKGLVINSFDYDGISIRSDNNTIVGNYIGTNNTGDGILGYYCDSGIQLMEGASNNIIGGVTNSTRNIISGNDYGITINGLGGEDVSNNTIQGNYIGTDKTGEVDLGNDSSGIRITGGASNNLIGGTVTGAGNLISGNNSNGILVLNSNSINNSIQGNLIGTNVDGESDLGNSHDGIRLQGAANTIIGGNTASARNIISGNNHSGISIFQAGSTDNIIQGNYIGTNITGLEAIGNNTYGIRVYGSDNNVLGGGQPGEGNLISGNINTGILLEDSSDNNTIQGNKIGLDVNGNSQLGNSIGIHIANTGTNNLIGGTGEGQGNEIAGNDTYGILINTTANTENSILGNSIYDNNSYGIDLAGNGVTLNDAMDSDTGANFLQNFAVLNSANSDGTDITVSGSLNSTENTNFRLEFFANVAEDDSGHGEAERYLGFTNVTTDASGNIDFTNTFTVPVLAGEFISSTATRADTTYSQFYETSEFSTNIVVNAPVVRTSQTVLQYIENGTTEIDTELLVSSANDSDLIEATVSITNNFNSSRDSLLFTNQAGITGSYNAGTGVLTLNGTASVAAYQIALRSVSYNNNSEQPNVLIRTISFIINDGTNNSLSATRDINITPVNDAPTVETTIPDQDLIEDFAEYSIDLNAAFTDPETADADLGFTVTDNTNITVTIANGIATITNTPDWNGSETITFTAADEEGVTVSQEVLFTVSAVADITNDGTVTVVEDTPTSIDVLSNDSFENTPTVTATTDPANGTVAINADNTITYTPDANYNGADTFTYSVTSGGVIETATVTLDITPVNDLPTVETTIPDQDLIEDFAEYSIDLNAAFTDPETADADLGFTVTDNTNITVIIANGIATITNTPDWNGSETITFTAADAEGVTVSQEVLFTVFAVADITNDGTVTVVEDTPTSIDVLSNDSFENTPTVTATTDPANGTVAINADNTITYTPDANYNGADTFTYSVTSGGVIETATVTLDITPVNDLPTVETTIPDQDLIEDFAEYSIDLNAAFTDPETADADLGFTVTDNTNITVTIANGIATITNTPDWNGSETITFTAADAEGVTVSQEVLFTVSAVADITNDGTVTVVEDTPTSIDVLSNDSFENTPTVTATTDPANGTVAINADNTITYTPDANYNGADTFTYSVTSGGVIETATVTLDITPVNDLPTVETTIPDQDLIEDFAEYSIDLNAAFTDPETADADLGFTVTDNTNITVTIANGIATITNTPDWNGSETITFTAADAEGVTVSQEVLFTVSAVADITNDGTVTVVEDTPTSIDVLSNDSFENTPTVTATTDPANGTVAINADNTITYTPDANYNGADTFTYSVTSGGVIETATVTLDITPVNDLPTVETTIPDQDLIEDFAEYSIDLNAAFTDPETADADLGFTVTDNTNIIVTIANGIATITNTPDWNGSETITFTAADAEGVTVSQEVLFTVSAVADITNDGTVTVVEDTPTSIDVLSNDSFENTPTVTATTDPANGTVAINADNTITYTPDANYNGADTFTYSVTSGGVIETATVTLDITPVNDLPTVETTIPDQDLIEDFAEYSIDLNAAFTDPETADADLGFTVTDNTNITVTIANGIATITNTPDWNGSETITFTAADEEGVTVSQEVLFTVFAVADITNDGTVTVVEDTPTSIDVLSNDSFENTPTVTATTDPANGTVAINADNTITYTPDANYNGADTFTYSVTSGGVIETATVTLDITPVNDLPTVETTIPDQDLIEDFAEYSIDLNAAFTDPETADADLGFTVTDNTNITVTIANGIATITNTPDWNGSETITFTAADAEGVTVSQEVLFTVSAVADITNDGTVTVVEDTPTSIDVLSNDSFENTPTVTATTDPANGTVAINADNTITYTPDANYNGADTFTYSVTSGGVIETATVTLDITPVNDAPTVETTIPDQDLTEDFAEYSIDLNAAFTDPETADADLGFTVTDNTNITVTIANGIATITNTPDWNGSETITFTATDAEGVTVSQEVLFTVSAVADITNDGTVTVVEDTPTSIDVLSNDSFENTPTVTATTDPANGTVAINADNTITYTPDANYNGADTFTYSVTSGGVIETATVTLNITPVNDAPTVETTIPDQDLTEDFAEYSIDLNAAFTDPETADADLGFTVTDNTNITVTIANGIATITNTPDWNGSETLTFTATDEGGLEVYQIVEFNVSNVNDSPVLNSIGNRTINVLVELTFTVSATDIDDVGTTLTYSLDATSIASGMAIDTVTGDFTWTPAKDQDGEHSVIVTVTDNGVVSYSDSEAFNIMVTDINDTVLDDNSGTDTDDITEPNDDETTDNTNGNDDNETIIVVPSTEVEYQDLVNDEEELNDIEDIMVSDFENDQPKEEDLFDDEFLQEDEESIIIVDSENIGQIADILTGIESQVSGYHSISEVVISQTNESTDSTSQMPKERYSRMLLGAIKTATSETLDFISPSVSAAPLYMNSPDPNGSVIMHETMKTQLSYMNQEMDQAFENSAEEHKIRAYMASGMSASLAIGTASYLLRGGSLLSSFLTTVPLWKAFDPVAILLIPKKKKKDREAIDKNASPSALSNEQKAESMFAGKENS